MPLAIGGSSELGETDSVLSAGEAVEFLEEPDVDP
jgi:hypothetical protein